MTGLRLGWGRTTPLVLQAEVAECGLACLAMVAAHHGLVMDLRTLRQRTGAVPRGASLELLAELAQRLALRGRALRLEPEELGQLACPAILHWEMHHFVVLERMHGTDAEILDPARGARRVSQAELSAAFTGVALELTPTPAFERGDAAQRMQLGDLFRGVTGLRGLLVKLLMISLAVQVLALASPLAMQFVVDEVLVSRDHGLLVAIAAGAGLLLLTQTTLSVARALFVQAFTTRLSRAIHVGLFEHLTALPLGYLAQRHSGDVVSRFGSLDAIQRVLTTGFVEAIIDGALSVVALVMMYAYSPTLATIAVVGTASYLALRCAWYAPSKAAAEEQIHHGARRQTHLLETLRAMTTLRVYGGENARVAHQDDLNCNALNAALRSGRLGIAASTANGLVFGVEGIAVLWAGASAVMAGGLSLGMLMAFMSFKGTFSARAAGLVDRWIDFRMLDLHAERVGGIALEPKLPQAPRQAIHAGGPARVEFEQLGFRYPQGRWLFRDLTRAVAPGRCLAIVGPSGCGKSTLAKLLLGLLEPTTGAVMVDGRAVVPAYGADPRYGVTAVLQDDALLSGTLADNIALHAGAPDLVAVERAARAAAIHDEIMAMPMRYDTLVGEMGSSLSGGQRQRLLLARALYFEPTLLVLDEATSHLDPARERSVVEHLRALPMTRIVIAHRAETIRLADDVLDLSSSVLRPVMPNGFGMQA